MNIYDYFNKPTILNGYNDRLCNVPICAYQHAISINDLFPEGEKAIASDSYCACLYAKHIIKERFPEGEKAIASNSKHAYYYAVYIIKQRFPIGEIAINSDPEYKTKYKNFLNSL